MVAHLKKGFKFNRGIWIALSSTIFAGLAVVFDALYVKNYDPISYLVLENFLMACILLIVYPKTFKQLHTFAQKDFLKKMIPLSFFSCLQAILYYYALSVGPASQNCTY